MVQAPHPSIFVSIASYRDPDCANTVRDLFRKASEPSRVWVGICLQWVPESDADCWPLAERPEQCRVDAVHAAESGGACWARARAQALWAGEDYYFQIDSHMRFVDGWDALLLDMLGECDSSKPVLSTYPLRFEPPDVFQRDTYVTVAAKLFESGGVLVQKPESEAMSRAPARPSRSPFVAAGMLFLPARAMQETPYDPHLYFLGEEISLGVRLFTHGWDVFTPNRVVAYHDYTVKPSRPRHWDDTGDPGRSIQRARARLRHLLGMQHSDDPEIVADLDRYGLGEARSLADFEAFSGADFHNRLLRGPYPGDPAEGAEGAKAAEQRRTVFTRASERSAEQPSLDAAAVREQLPAVLRFLGVETLVDAGCGEPAWIPEVSEGVNLYLGYDIVEDVAARQRQRFAARRNHCFLQADVVIHDLPRADVILCRDTLTHLPPDAVLAALRRFKASGSRYLLATTHPLGRNGYTPPGGWQPMNLTAPPFNLPQPLLSIDERRQDSSKSLAVWRTSDLPS